MHVSRPSIWFTLFVVFHVCRCSFPDIDTHPNWDFLPKKNCGQGASADRIVGGKEAALGQFPWLVRIGYELKEHKISYLCAGSLINHWYIITANHCFLDILGRTIKEVRLGENNLGDAIDCDNDLCAPPVQDIGVDYIVRFHDASGAPITYGDIGLIKLVRPAKINDFVYPICLPRGDLIQHLSDFLYEGSMVEVAGWGTTDPERNRVPDKLMYLMLPVVNLDKCKRNFAQHEIDDSQICIGAGDGKDTCVGDSGGSIMKPISLNGPPKYFLLGIVSYGMKWCGLSSAVYTNVTHYMTWILNNMEPIP